MIGWEDNNLEQDGIKKGGGRGERQGTGERKQRIPGKEGAPGREDWRSRMTRGKGEMGRGRI